jgi:hypothetical protein
MRNARRRFLVATATLASGFAAAHPGAEPVVTPDDWRAIRGVVIAQREALVAGDDAKAYAQASPDVRAQYATPSAFAATMRRRYAPLVEARDAALLDGAVIGGDVIQPLQLVLPDGTVLVALFTMARQRDGAWRIAGCLIAPSVRKSA